MPERGDELRRLIDDCEQRTPSPLQTYVLARLEGVSGPKWLDSETLEQAVRTSEYVGVLVEFGPSTKPSDLTHDQRDQADRVGFAVIAEGEAEIRRALADAQAAFADTGATPRRRKIFGGLYEWVSSTKLHKAPGDIRRIMREHIFDTMEIAAGEIILGGSLTERRLHSVQSLAIESGLNPKTLRNVLAASELIPADAKVIANHVFDAEAGRKVAAPVPQAVSVSKLGNVLGCTRPQADQFLDERLLLPLPEGPKESAGRVWKSVGKDEVDQFVADLHASVRFGRASWHGFDLESGREVEGAERRDCPSHSRRLPRERRTESRRPRSRGIARRFGRGPDRAGRSCAGKLCDGSVRQTAYSEIRRLASRSSGNRTAPSRNGRRRQERTASVL